MKVLIGDSLLLGINPQLDQIQRSTLSQLAASHSLPLVGVSPVEYLNADDLFTSKVLQAIDANTQLENVEEKSKELGKKLSSTPGRCFRGLPSSRS